MSNTLSASGTTAPAGFRVDSGFVNTMGPDRPSTTNPMAGPGGLIGTRSALSAPDVGYSGRKVRDLPSVDFRWPILSLAACMANTKCIMH